MLTNCKVLYGKSKVTSKCVEQLTSPPGPALMQGIRGWDRGKLCLHCTHGNNHGCPSCGGCSSTGVFGDRHGTGLCVHTQTHNTTKRNKTVIGKDNGSSDLTKEVFFFFEKYI